MNWALCIAAGEGIFETELRNFAKLTEGEEAGFNSVNLAKFRNSVFSESPA